MISYKTAASATLLAVLLLGCSETPAPSPPAQVGAADTTPSPPAAPAPSETTVPDRPFASAELRATTEWDSLVDAEGNVWVSFRDLQGDLILQRLSASAEQAPIVLDEASHEPVEPRLLAGPQGPELLWRPKRPLKELKYGRLPAGAPASELSSTVIGFKSEPLAEYQLWQKGDLRVAVWQGEAKVGEEEYNYYLSHSADSGSTWSGEQLLGPGGLWTWLYTEDALVLFMWDVVGPGRWTITQRTFDLSTRTLSPETRVEEVSHLNPAFEAIQSGDRWVLMWIAKHGATLDSQRIEGMYSDDRGATWTRYALEETKGLDPGPFSLVADGRGNVLVAFYARTTDADDSKHDIHLFRSRDNGASWQPLERPRPAEFSNTKAIDAIADYDPETGEILLAWQDYRDILPNVYVAASRDWGDTWSAPRAVGRPGLDRIGTTTKGSSFKRTPGGTQLIVEENTDPGFTRKRLRLIDVKKLGEQPDAAQAQQPGRTEEGLRARVESLWSLFEKGDYAGAYDYFDPTFRALQPKEHYVLNKGRIQYHSFNIEGIDIRGSVAQVKMRIEASVPAFESRGGQTISQPKEARETQETWLFIGDNWYREHYDELSRSSLISY